MIKVEEYDVLTLNCSTYGNLPITSYKWFFNGKIIKGATNERYEKTNVTRRDAGNYSCEVSNGIQKKASDNVAVIALCKFMGLIFRVKGTIDRF